MKQAEDTQTGELPLPARRGRPPKFGKAMTAAERKARSRTLQLGALAVDLEQAAKLAGDWGRCMEVGRPAATDKDIEGAFKELALWIARAQLHMPQA